MLKNITHLTFKKEYNSNLLLIYINRKYINEFVTSQIANQNNKRAYIFYKRLSWVIIVLMPIILFLKGLGLVSLSPILVGWFILSANDKSGKEFLIDNMLDDEKFWNYITLNKGAYVVDKVGNYYLSDFLIKMHPNLKDEYNQMPKLVD